jgi:predicted RNA-binding Zn ribbon-like protein
MPHRRAEGELTWGGAGQLGVTDWPCLDLANCVRWRLHDPANALASYGDVVRWARHERLLDDQEARRLLDRAAERPRRAAAAQRRTVALQEAVRAVLAAVAAGATPPATALAGLHTELARAMVPVRLVPQGVGFRREWLDSRDDLGWMLGPVARSAADLLVSPELHRLKECQGSPGRGCGFLFVDRTRNGSRRWCSGATCGNRTRLHRHHARSGPASA